MSLALVVLAAGEGRRLGANKALVRLRDEEPATPLAMLLAAGRGEQPALVVTGAHHDAIALALAGQAGVELAHNTRWAEGRTGGVRLASERRAGLDLVLAPVDVPLVPAAVFAALDRAWDAAGRPPHGWLAPYRLVDGRPRHGHPVVLGRELVHALADLAPDRPLRALRALARPVLDVRVPHAEILDDLDDPADLERLRRRLRPS